jgi:2',3'-cyclic-nucleotide 2'-phosphodiesterase (5'-nucleotidase family)
MRFSPYVANYTPSSYLNSTKTIVQRQGLNLNEVKIITFNDVYHPNGVARIYSVLKNLLNKDPSQPILVLFGGDLLSPSPESELTGGSHLIDGMNALFKLVHGKLIAVLGNHDFDKGVENLKKQVNRSLFTWLGGNLFQNGRHLNETPAYKIMKVNGRRILVYGVCIPEVYTKLPQNVHLEDPLSQIEKHLPEIIMAHRPDMTILLAHLGEDYYQRLSKLPINLAIVGHEHNSSILRETSVPVVCADANARSHSDINVEFREPKLLWERLQALMHDLVFGKLPASNVKNITTEIKPTEDSTPSPEVLATIDPCIRRYSESLNKPLATLPEPLDFTFENLRRGQETAEGNCIADWHLAAWNHFNPAAPVDVAMIHAGCLRSDNKITNALFTRRDLAELLPYQDIMLRIEADEKLIKSILEESLHLRLDDIPNKHPGHFMNISGLTVEVDMTKAYGERVTSIKNSKGDFLEDSYKLYLTVSKFLTERRSGLSSLRCYVKKHPERVQKGVQLPSQTFGEYTVEKSYLEAYLESLAQGSGLPTISLTKDGRWTIKNQNLQ